MRVFLCHFMSSHKDSCHKCGLEIIASPHHVHRPGFSELNWTQEPLLSVKDSRAEPMSVLLHLFVVATITLMCLSLCVFVVITSCFYTKKISESRCKCVQIIYILIVCPCRRSDFAGLSGWVELSRQKASSDAPSSSEIQICSEKDRGDCISQSVMCHTAEENICCTWKISVIINVLRMAVKEIK